jgi:hypothetical protein
MSYNKVFSLKGRHGVQQIFRSNLVYRNAKIYTPSGKGNHDTQIKLFCKRILTE